MIGLGTLKKLREKLYSRLATLRGKNKEFIILDFREKTITLPTGEVITVDDIIGYDPATKTLTYRAPDGTLKTTQLEIHLPSPEEIEKLKKQLARQDSETIHI